jgi:hypothetical protein
MCSTYFPEASEADLPPVLQLCSPWPMVAPTTRSRDRVGRGGLCFEGKKLISPVRNSGFRETNLGFHWT